MRELVNKVWRPAVVLLLLLIIWQFAVTLFKVEAWLLPSPITIGKEALNGWDTFSVHLLSTTQLSLVGFSIGTAVGLVIAIMLHRVSLLKKSIYPLLILTQNIPIIVLAPLLIIWFGFGLLPKLIIITLVCFFPITIACLDGFMQTPKELKHYMQMSGANPRQLFWKLEWPYSLPSLFSGLKISATYSVMGAVISEWLGAKSGVGVYMNLASSSFRTDRVFVAILAIMILSLLFFIIIQILEKWFVHNKGRSA